MVEARNRQAFPWCASAVVFDLDGVLVDSTGAVERAWRRWAAEQEVCAKDVLDIAHGRPAREVVRAFAPHLDAEQQSRRLDEWETQDPERLTVIPGAMDSVVAASRRRWAIVTSGGKKLATSRLQNVGLPVPEVLITADDITFGKPNPEPYQSACRRLGVSAGESIAVEDAPAGITAAKTAGLTVIAVTTTHPAAALQGADLVLGSMHDVGQRLNCSER